MVTRCPEPAISPDGLVGISPEWARWCRRWYETSTLGPGTRRDRYGTLLRVGCWLAAEHPGITSPEQWTRDLAVRLVADVDRWHVGEWVVGQTAAQTGKPLAPSTKVNQLAAIKTFFADCQEWGWLPRRFDPYRSFATPRSIQALIAPNPRPIDDALWAKLLWAGLNLSSKDLDPENHIRRPANAYPFEMVQAVALTWLFGGLRAGELRRLRMGCVRWPPLAPPMGGSKIASNKMCYLDVPAHKTGSAYTKPVDAIVGESVEAWQLLRPPAAPALDPWTGELVDFLFDYEGVRLGVHYLNKVLIPLLCRKAGIRQEDSQGRITSHRARATIASHLANAQQPMSLVALRDWLGHRTVTTTLHYVRGNPAKLARAYTDAEYFARNVRMVGVLVDREAIRSGATARGEAWKFYDLGHGYCTYDFFEQCPHRMACARCAFYRPKDSTREQLLEARGNLLRLMQEIPLTEEEQAAVEEGLEAVERLSARLADTPTPTGQTPRQMRMGQPDSPIIPVDSIEVRS